MQSDRTTSNLKVTDNWLRERLHIKKKPPSNYLPHNFSNTISFVTDFLQHKPYYRYS